MEQTISELIFETKGQGFTDITNEVNTWIKHKGIIKGILILYAKHTSCSLTISENADPTVLKDLTSYINALVPENSFSSMKGDIDVHYYAHSSEGPDDMPAHIKTVLTNPTLTLSINHSKVVLGTWQAIYLWEHRSSRHTRYLNIHAIT